MYEEAGLLKQSLAPVLKEAVQDFPETQQERDVPGTTTVMLRNVPNNYTRAAFLGMLDAEGFSGAYDFVYLPIDFRSHACLGYAFVNLRDPSCVRGFWQRFDGFSRWCLPSRKVCKVNLSEPHQGLAEHVERYRPRRIGEGLLLVAIDACVENEPA